MLPGVRRNLLRAFTGKADWKEEVLGSCNIKLARF